MKVQGESDGAIVLQDSLDKLKFFSPQASYDLPPATNYEPFTPRLTVDSKKVTSAQAFATSLKQNLTEMLKRHNGEEIKVSAAGT